MAYFQSNKVSVFPSTYRTQGTGKFTSEFNFTNIINSLVDKSSFQSGDDGFVLDYNTSDNTLKVIIHGYYFEILGYIPSKNTKILEIKIADGAEYLANYGTSSTNLDPGDDFEGIDCKSEISTNIENGYSYYHVHVCDDLGNIINKARLVTDSILYKDLGKVDQTVTKELNAKHYNLKVGKGLQGTGTDGALTNIQNQDNEIRIADDEQAKLDSLENNIGNNGKRLVYFTSNGVANNSNLGAGYSFMKDGSYYKEQTMYIEQDKESKGITKGEIKNGFTVWAGTGEVPSTGNLGDIYFKYQ